MTELSKDPLFKHYVDGVRRAEFTQLGFSLPGGWPSALVQEAIEGKRSAREALEEVQRDAAQRHTDWKARNKK